jgi:hypothetical protein
MNEKKDLSSIHRIVLICIGVATIIFFFFKILVG